MTWYLKAYIIENNVAHIQCSDLPIENPALEIEYQYIEVSAEVNGEYQDASEVLPLLSWDGQALSGVSIISQTVEAGGE